MSLSAVEVLMSVMLQNLINGWPALFGYPAIAAALILAVLALRKKRAAYAFTGFVLIAPLSFYILSSPTLWWLGVLVPATLLGISISVAVNNRRKVEN